MKRILSIAAAAIVLVGCGSAKKAATTSSKMVFPNVDQNGKTAIVAHRGYWNCEAAGYSENSIASLREAQRLGFWGSECDIHITADDKVIVNHDGTINGKRIQQSKFEDLAKELLPNGERRPSLDEYLTQAEKSTKTKLVIEFKKMLTPEREDLLIEKTLAALKAHKLYSPKRVAFISFSHHVCQVLAKKCPEFTNQYLNGELSPEQLAAEGINGIDYQFNVIGAHPGWVKDCKDRGMSSNVWTVNKENMMDKMIGLQIGAITTNFPEKVREKLGAKEFKN